MKILTTISHGEFDYECVIARPCILSVRKIGHDSGVPFDVKFDELPPAVREKILKRVEGNDE